MAASDLSWLCVSCTHREMPRQSLKPFKPANIRHDRSSTGLLALCGILIYAIVLLMDPAATIGGSASASRMLL